MQTLYSLLYQALIASDPDKKCAHTFAAYERWCAGSLHDTPVPDVPVDVLIAGRPARPELVPHTQVDARKPSTPEGYAAMLHAIAHIEFNAINLGLDAAYRFRRLPREFVGDWLGVAKEECEHFLLMRERLREHGYDYGDFVAHAHLWDMARHTAYDPLLRMALVPRVLEARGLDVTPAIRAKVAQKGDEATCAVLDIIYRDEVGHVRIGNRWYHHLCRQRGLEPLSLFRQLLRQHDMFVFRGYVNLEARQRAGFSEFELSLLRDFEDAQKLGHSA